MTQAAKDHTSKLMQTNYLSTEEPSRLSSKQQEEGDVVLDEYNPHEVEKEEVSAQEVERIKVLQNEKANTSVDFLEGSFHPTNVLSASQ